MQTCKFTQQKPQMTTSVRFVIALLMLVTSVQSLAAEELNLFIPGSNNCQLRTTDSFPTEYSEIQYSEESGVFSYEAKFTSQNSSPLPDVVHFVVTPSNQALYYAGRYVDIYIDAKDKQNPIVSAYTFNGGDPLKVGYQINLAGKACTNSFVHSFNDRDPQDGVTLAEPLFTTKLGGAGNIVLLKEIRDETVNGLASRTFEIKLAANSIIKSTTNYCKDIAHLNAPACSFDGLTISQSGFAGFTWYASSNSTISYNPSGYISSLSWNKCGACFNQGLQTNRSPICQAVSVSSPTVNPGQTLNVALEFYDRESDSLTANFANLPENALTSPSAGGTLFPSPTTGRGTINLTWTPRASQAGDYTVTAFASQNYGANKATSNCAFSVKVNSLGAFADSCKFQDMNPAKSIINTSVGKIRSGTNKLMQILKRNRLTTRREQNFQRKINSNLQLINSKMSLITDSGYAGSCPSYCPEDINITLARIDLKALLLETRIAAVKIGRQAIRKLKSSRRLPDSRAASSITSEISSAESSAQKAFDTSIPAELFYCQF
jgi:hypothetical protein